MQLKPSSEFSLQAADSPPQTKVCILNCITTAEFSHSSSIVFHIDYKIALQHPWESSRRRRRH